MEKEPSFRWRLVLANAAADAPREKSKRHPRAAACTGLPTLWPGTGEANAIAPENVWCEALGLAAVGAIADRSLVLGHSGGLLLNSGIDLLVCTHNGAEVAAALHRILAPQKIAYLKPAAVAEIDQECTRQALETAKAEYRHYRQSDMLPDPQHVEYYARKIARLEQNSNPLVLLENPLPGHLTLAIGKRPKSRYLAIYDDFAFAGLLDKARSARGILDIDLLTRSWHQQPFHSSQLEGVHQQPVLAPAVWAIIVARPETCARFLLSQDSLLAGFASCCWMLDGTGPLNCPQQVT